MTHNCTCMEFDDRPPMPTRAELGARTWLCKDGRRMFWRDMDERHLFACARMLDMKARGYASTWHRWDSNVIEASKRVTSWRKTAKELRLYAVIRQESKGT